MGSPEPAPSFAPLATRRPELAALTWLRFVLALYTLLYHVLCAWNPGRCVPGLLSAGYVGVNGFFVLSGFVLAYTYEGASGAAGGTLRFFRARFARVYPMHVVGILLSLPLLVTMSRAAHAPEPAIVAEAWRETVAVGLLVQAWIPARALDLNGPSWSLSVEAFFYLCFPFLLRVLAPLRVRSLLVLLVVAFGLALLPPLVHPLALGVAGVTLEDRVVLFNPLVHLPELVLGLLGGLLFLARRPSGSRWRTVAAGAALALLGLLTASPSFPVGLLHNGLLDPLLLLLIYSLATLPQPLLASPLRRAASILGRASYSLYILHKPLYLWMARAAGVGRAPPSATFVLLFVIVSISASVLMWAGVEEPARRWLRGPLSSARPPRTSA